MIGYITVGTNDFTKASEFYDKLFEVIGVKRLWTHGENAAWANSREECAFCLVTPFNKEEATYGNGSMIALRMPDQSSVKKVYSKAIELGATDEGAPGPRGEHGFFGGYFRDLDGNKLNAYVPARGKFS